MLPAKVWTRPRGAPARLRVMKKQKMQLLPRAIFAIMQIKDGKGRGCQTSENQRGKRQVMVAASSFIPKGTLLVVICYLS